MITRGSPGEIEIERAIFKKDFELNWIGDEIWDMLRIVLSDLNICPIY